MPQRITNISVVVFRDGKRQLLQPNTKFDFTADEVKNIEGAHKGALRKADSDQDRILDLTQAESPKPKAPEDDNKEKAPEGEKPLTAAQKKKQAEAEAKAKLADEQKSSDADEGDL